MSALLHNPEFWVFVAFVLAAALVWNKAKAAVGAVLDERAAKIRSELDEAQRLREEAQATLALYQRKQRDALKEAEEIIAHARVEAERLAQQAQRDLETALERREALAGEKIAQAEQKALAEVRGTAVDVAIAATRRLIAEELDPAKRNALIDDAIAVLPQRLH